MENPHSLTSFGLGDRLIQNSFSVSWASFLQLERKRRSIESFQDELFCKKKVLLVKEEKLKSYEKVSARKCAFKILILKQHIIRKCQLPFHHRVPVALAISPPAHPPGGRATVQIRLRT